MKFEYTLGEGIQRPETKNFESEINPRETRSSMDANQANSARISTVWINFERIITRW